MNADTASTPRSTPADRAAGERTALLIRPSDPSTADAEPVVWFGPILADLNRPGEGFELWVDSPYGSERVPEPWRCDTEADTPSGCCDAPAVAGVGLAWMPACAAHLPAGAVAPPPEALTWRLVTWVDDPAACVDQLATAALAAFAFCEANRGYNLADLVSAGLRRAAETVGGSDQLVSHRPGSWEADHVAALAATFDEFGR